MYSKRAAREWHNRKTRTTRKPESESNDIEEISSQSFAAGDSGERSHKSLKIERLSSYSSKRGRRTDDDTEDYFSDVRQRKEIASTKKKAHPRSGSKGSAEEILSDDVYDDKDDEDDTPEHKRSSSGSKKRRKSKKRNGSHLHESTGERDSSIKKDNGKSKKKKRHGPDKSSELPITEILKKAQEQRTKYEEPIPLPELTTDTIYVQGKNGFSAVRIGGNGKQSRRYSEAGPSRSSPRPIKVAIVFQKLWRSSGFIFQGLLGGMAMLHFIFMETYFNDSEEFINNYSALSEIYTCTFSFLIAMCIISTFDKFDLAHIGADHLREIWKYHLKSILAIPLYIAAFSLHQVTLKVEDKLTLLHYNSSNITYHSMHGFNETHGDIEVDELKTWQRMTLSKDALAVFGWIFVSIGNREDMLLTHLVGMDRFTENMNPSI